MMLSRSARSRTTHTVQCHTTNTYTDCQLLCMFHSCGSLASVSMAAVTKIASKAFKKCGSGLYTHSAVPHRAPGSHISECTAATTSHL